MVAELTEQEGLVQTLEKLREVAHTAYHVLEASEHSEIRMVCGGANVDDLERALQAFTDHCDPGGPGCTDAHAACFTVDTIAGALSGPSFKVAFDVMRERARQLDKEGWSFAHDDQYSRGELSRAAACYAALASAAQRLPLDARDYREAVPNSHIGWPWLLKWWKPKDPRRDLVRAGALIVAELERLDRAEEAGS